MLRPGDAEGLELARRLHIDARFAEREDERAASVRAAVRAVSSDAEGLLVALADQPFLEPADFAALLTEFARDPQAIVRARYAGEPGTPVIFARAFFPELLQLEGKHGGRRVIAAHPDQVGQYRSGQGKVFGFFVGQVMKASGGKADPRRVNELLRARLDR